MGLSFGAQVTIERPTPARVRIAMREGGGGLVSFVVFVLVLATALYMLMPEARARPAPLLGLLAVASVWLSATACEAARGTSSCGGGPGLVILVATVLLYASAPLWRG